MTDSTLLPDAFLEEISTHGQDLQQRLKLAGETHGLTVQNQEITALQSLLNQLLACQGIAVMQDAYRGFAKGLPAGHGHLLSHYEFLEFTYTQVLEAFKQHGLVSAGQGQGRFQLDRENFGLERGTGHFRGDRGEFMVRAESTSTGRNAGVILQFSQVRLGAILLLKEKFCGLNLVILQVKLPILITTETEPLASLQDADVLEFLRRSDQASRFTCFQIQPTGM